LSVRTKKLANLKVQLEIRQYMKYTVVVKVRKGEHERDRE
jgi:hypothetical protein